MTMSRCMSGLGELRLIPDCMANVAIVDYMHSHGSVKKTIYLIIIIIIIIIIIYTHTLPSLVVTPEVSYYLCV